MRGGRGALPDFFFFFFTLFSRPRAELATVCLRLFSSHLFWTSSSLDVPAGVTHEECYKGFLAHRPSAVHAFILLATRIQPFLSFVNLEVEFCVLRPYLMGLEIQNS